MSTNAAEAVVAQVTAAPAISPVTPVVTPEERETIFEDLLTGSDSALTVIDVSKFKMKIQTVYLRQPSARDVFELADRPGPRTIEERAEQEKAPFFLLAKCLARQDGTALLAEADHERVFELPMGVLTFLVGELMKSLGLVVTQSAEAIKSVTDTTDAESAAPADADIPSDTPAGKV